MDISTKNNPDFIEFLQHEFENSKKDIFSVNYLNEKIWIKKARETDASRVHKICYKIFPLNIILLGEKKDALQAVKFESKKMINLKSKGVNIPKILHVENNFFVMEDSGEVLHEILKDKKLNDIFFYNLIDLAIKQLSILHNLDEFHGGSQTRNFTYKNDKIFLIDFEESFPKNTNINTLKFRDFLLFLLSLAKIQGREINYKYIIDSYFALTKNSDVKKKLYDIAKKISFLTKLSKIKLINNLLGNDVKKFFILFDTINQQRKKKINA